MRTLPASLLCASGLAGACGLPQGGLAASDALDGATAPLDAAVDLDAHAARGDGAPSGRDGASDAGPRDGASSGGEGGGSDAGGGGGGGTDATAGNDAGGVTTQLSCGSSPCAMPSTCCVTVSQNSQASYACSAGPCPAPGGGSTVVGLQCSGPANCAAPQICCVTDQGNNQLASACTDPAACSIAGGNQAQLCDPGAPDAGCPPGATSACGTTNVNDWGLPPGYGTCGDVPH